MGSGDDLTTDWVVRVGAQNSKICVNGRTQEPACGAIGKCGFAHAFGPSQQPGMVQPTPRPRTLKCIFFDFMSQKLERLAGVGDQVSHGRDPSRLSKSGRQLDLASLMHQ